MKLLILLLLGFGRPGDFDYYLLALSWSPEYCHSHRDSAQCSVGNHYGFVLHGLWPQSLNGAYPEHCSIEPEPLDPAALSRIMPDPSLVRHEWAMHGSCSGLSANQYFALIRKTFDSIRIPQEFMAPDRSFTIRPSEVKRAFERANPNLSDSSIAVNCPGNYLAGVEICVTKSGNPMSCPPHAARDCRANVIRVPPVR